MKRIVAVILSLLLTTNLLVGCKKGKKAGVDTSTTIGLEEYGITSENALAVYEYPSDIIFGLEKVVICKTSFQMFFTSEKYWLFDEETADDWSIDTDDEKDFEWNKEITFEKGKHIIRGEIINDDIPDDWNLLETVCTIRLNKPAVYALISVGENYTYLFYSVVTAGCFGSNGEVEECDGEDILISEFDFERRKWNTRDESWDRWGKRPGHLIGDGRIQIDLRAESVEVEWMIEQFLKDNPDLNA